MAGGVPCSATAVLCSRLTFRSKITFYLYSTTSFKAGKQAAGSTGCLGAPISHAAAGRPCLHPSMQPFMNSHLLIAMHPEYIHARTLLAQDVLDRSTSSSIAFSTIGSYMQLHAAADAIAAGPAQARARHAKPCRARDATDSTADWVLHGGGIAYLTTADQGVSAGESGKARRS